MTRLGLSVAGSCGLITLRPHLLLVGLATPPLAGLFQDDLLWAPRFVQARAFFRILACLGLASPWRPPLPGPTGPARPRLAAALLCAALLAPAGLGLRGQMQAAPLTAEVYRLRPLFLRNAADRPNADRLFATYLHACRPDEPAIASHFLFRSAHDQNPLWYKRGCAPPLPPPHAQWILWSLSDRPLAGQEDFLRPEAASRLDDFELVAEVERFVLLWRRPGKN